MSKKRKSESAPDCEEQIPVQEESTAEETPAEEIPAEETPAQETVEEEPKAQEKTVPLEQYLLMAAEYDNFRKRSQREKDGIYQTAVADTVKKFLPVYDNLLRALQNETADEAYKKGVEMTMNELKKILSSVGIEAFGEVGETFDPNKHNAVMHIEDDTLGENVIAELFQVGFALGEKVIRFAMVKVAN